MWSVTGQEVGFVGGGWESKDMSILQFIVYLTKALAWPGSILTLGLVFRSQIRSLIPKIKEIDLPIGKFSFGEATQKVLDVYQGLTGPTGPAAPLQIQTAPKEDTVLNKVAGAPVIGPNYDLDGTTNTSGAGVAITQSEFSSRALVMGSWLSLQKAILKFSRIQGFDQYTDEGEEHKLINALLKSGKINFELAELTRVIIDAINSLTLNFNLEMSEPTSRAFIQAANYAQQAYENDGRLPVPKLK